MDDRSVHARSSGAIVVEVVRYDRGGKWYLESSSFRRVLITLAVACERAASIYEQGGEVMFDLPGGNRFDLEVRRRISSAALKKASQ